MPETMLDPAYARLHKDVGEWDAEITVTPQPGAVAQNSKGRLTCRLISGGRWLIADFKNHTTGFEGHGIYGYNPGLKRFVGTWVDDMRTNLYVGEGEWDEPSATMTYTWKASMPNGQAMAWRETTKVISPDEQIFRVLFPIPDGSEFEMMRAHYRRV